VIVTVALEGIEHGSPAGCVCKRAMDEDDRWTSHIELLFGWVTARIARSSRVFDVELALAALDLFSPDQ
jgi:hypothetical protein